MGTKQASDHGDGKLRVLLQTVQPQEKPKALCRQIAREDVAERLKQFMLPAVLAGP